MKMRGAITLGPGGVLYLVVAALILAAAIYTQANLLFAAFGLVMGGLVVSAVWSMFALRGIEVRRELPAAGVAGRAMVVRYTVHNRSRLPAFSLVIEELASGDERFGVEAGAVMGWLAHVGPGQKANVEAPCWPARRGELELRGVEVWTAFPFGVFRRVRRWSLPQRVLILPGLRQIDRRWLPTSPWSAGYGTKQRGGASDAGEFFGLRDYREGDPPRVIDWKRSARLGWDTGGPDTETDADRGDASRSSRSVRLIARELTQPTPPRVMVLLDLSQREGPEADGLWGSEEDEDAITLAASILDAAHRHGFWSGLAVVGPGCPVFPPHAGLPHRARMLEALAGLDLRQRDRLPNAGMIVPSVIVRPGLPDVIGTDEKAVSGPAGAAVSGRKARVLFGGELTELAGPLDSETVDLTPEEASERDAATNQPTAKAGAA